MEPASIIVYWRPGCPFCASLLRRLDRSGLAFTRRNIWDDPEAAAAVRAVADGNETVPTVQVGGRHLVNPSAADVLRLVAAVVPEELPAGVPPAGPPTLRDRLSRLGRR